MSSIKKFLGIGLLAVGLVIVFYGLYSSYNIFSAKAPAPQLFTAEPVQVSSDKTGVEAQLQGLLQEQLKGFLPTNSIPQLLNLMSWSIFAGILIFGGGQVAGLGIKLIKWNARGEIH